MTDIWFTETLHAELRQQLRVDRVIYRSQTDHQDLVIFENEVLGRVLALDGVVQITEADEHIYQEMMAHVPLFGHGEVREVLIVGGGDGGILKRCLMHSVERVTMVEIDRGVVDLSREFLPSISDGAFDDPRFDLVIADGREFMAATDRRYDVIIVDSTDPIGPGEALFTQEFYRNCLRAMADPGVLITQSSVPFVQMAEFRTSARRLQSVFPSVRFFAAPVPTYYGGLMTLGWSSNDPTLIERMNEGLEARVAAAGLDTRYYTAAIHKAAFALPRDLERVIAEEAPGA